jgi:hypothetical protein
VCVQPHNSTIPRRGSRPPPDVLLRGAGPQEQQVGVGGHLPAHPVGPPQHRHRRTHTPTGPLGLLRAVGAVRQVHGPTADAVCVSASDECARHSASLSHAAAGPQCVFLAQVGGGDGGQSQCVVAACGTVWR